MNSINSINNTQMIKILLIFYLLVGNGSLESLLSKDWRNMINENRLIKHLVGLVTMITLASLFMEGTMDNLSIFIYSVIGYTWFVFSTKLDVHWNVIIILLLFSAYMYENSLKLQDSFIDKDKIMTIEEKDKKKNYIIKKRNYIFIGIFSITIFGMILYSKEKKVQYGGGYSLVNFLLY